MQAASRALRLCCVSFLRTCMLQMQHSTKHLPVSQGSSDICPAAGPLCKSPAAAVAAISILRKGNSLLLDPPGGCWDWSAPAEVERGSGGGDEHGNEWEQERRSGPSHSKAPGQAMSRLDGQLFDCAQRAPEGRQAPPNHPSNPNPPQALPQAAGAKAPRALQTTACPGTLPPGIQTATCLPILGLHCFGRRGF